MSDCFTCKEFLTVDEVVNVKTRGIATRGDEENERMLHSVQTVRVHVKCRKKYINIKMVAADVWRHSRDVAD